MVRRARRRAIGDGDWLGPFDAYTLIKRPGYPLFVALADALHVPLLAAQQLAYAGVWRGGGRGAPPCAAGPAFAARVRPGGVRPGHDEQLGVGARRPLAAVQRVLVLLLGCLVALVDAAPRAGRRLAGWGAATAAVLAAIWLVREEFPLVVPALAVALVTSVVVVARALLAAARRATAMIGVLLIPASVLLAATALRSVNDDRYGLAIDNLQRQSEAYAVGPMLRVSVVTEFDGYPVTTETRALIYAVSPTFASLRGQIESGGGLRFMTTRPDGVGDLNGSVFQWVVLDAVAATGQASTAREMDATFRAIGGEIDTACDDGRIVCGPPYVGITPPSRWGDTVAIAERTVYATWRTALIAPFDATPPDGDAVGPDRDLFSRVTREPLTPGGDGALTSARASLIRMIRLAYLALTALAVASIGYVVTGAARSIGRRRRPDPLIITTVSIGCLLSGVRLAGLAYLDVTAFQALSPSYLAPAHAVGALVLAVAVLGRRQDDGATIMPTDGGTAPDSARDHAAWSPAGPAVRSIVSQRWLSAMKADTPAASARP